MMHGYEGETEQTHQRFVDVALLIELIQNYEFLYDLSNKDYKNSKKKDLAWKELALILDASVEECMKCWKNIRDRFVKEKNKNRSGDEAPELTWPHYNAMLFYGKITKRRNTYSSADKGKRRKEVMGIQEGRPSSSSSTESTKEGVLCSITPILGTENEPEVRPVLSKGSRGKYNTVEDNNCLKEVMNAAKDIASCIKGTSSESNTNKKFAEYIYARLEEMPVEEGKDKRKRMLMILEGLDE